MINNFLNKNTKKKCKFFLKATLKVNIPADHNERELRVIQRAKELNLTLIKYEISTIHSPIFYKCNNCDIINQKGVELRDFLGRKPKCCENKARQKPPGDKLIVLLEERGHELIGSMPIAYKGVFTLRCKKHCITAETTFDKYKKTKHGMRCCGNEQGAKKRIITGESVGRKNPQWRIAADMRKWANQVKILSEGKCFFTEESDLVQVHHIYSAKDYPSMRYCIDNGIVLHKALHRGFHSYVGWKNEGSPEDLVEFILKFRNFDSVDLLETNTLKGLKIVNIESKIEALKIKIENLKSVTLTTSL